MIDDGNAYVSTEEILAYIDRYPYNSSIAVSNLKRWVKKHTVEAYPGHEDGGWGCPVCGG